MRIGELAAMVGTSTKTLRFYEAEGLLLQVERTPAGYRDYGADAVARIDFIQRAKAAGLTLAQTREILRIRDRGKAPCAHVRDLLDARIAEIDLQIDQIRNLRDTIGGLRKQAAHPDPETCGPEEICRYL